MTMLFSYDNPGRVIGMKPMQGDMQGDVSAPQKFCLSFDAVQEEMAADSRTMLEERALGFVEPLSGSLHHADHVRYADDLLTVGLVSSFRQVAWRALDWDRSWRQFCTIACLEA
eukprot:1857400-Heterocapsa_arctica.AAC.1